MMDLKEFAEIIQEHVPSLGRTLVEVEEIKKGGSDRSFFRLRWAHGAPLIAVQYPAGGKDNLLYVQISELLRRIGVNAPEVIFHDPGKGVFGMEDLGGVDLWDSHTAPWAEQRPLYQSALEQVYCLHTHGLEALANTEIELHEGFEVDLYLWEQGYFFEHCLGQHFGLSAERIADLSSLPALHKMAERLAKLPRVLVHRDFQSQNIMIREGEVWLIDFQGVRTGLAQYDLASLLYDPYVTLTAAQREELLEYYLDLMRADGREIAADFQEIFRCCAIQRLMQALGAYGFLGHSKNLGWFLQHIPTAFASLRSVVAEVQDLAALEKVLDATCLVNA